MSVTRSLPTEPPRQRSEFAVRRNSLAEPDSGKRAGPAPN